MSPIKGKYCLLKSLTNDQETFGDEYIDRHTITNNFVFAISVASTPLVVKTIWNHGFYVYIENTT